MTYPTPTLTEQHVTRVADLVAEHSFDHEVGECMCGHRGRPGELATHVARVIVDRVVHLAEQQTIGRTLKLHQQHLESAYRKGYEKGRAESTTEALLAAARYFEYEMAPAWGGDARWLSTGSHVADLVADVLRERAQGGDA